MDVSGVSVVTVDKGTCREVLLHVTQFACELMGVFRRKKIGLDVRVVSWSKTEEN